MLRGENILLRAIERDDLARLHLFNNDFQVELAGGGDPPMPQSMARLEAEFDQNIANGGREGAVFGIEKSGLFIGQCALFNFNETNRRCELGITIGDKTHWGQGYGREAVNLLVEYAFQYRNMHRVWLEVIGNNERAIRAYKSVGFEVEGTLREHIWSNGRYHDIIVMGLLQTCEKSQN